MVFISKENYTFRPIAAILGFWQFSAKRDGRYRPKHVVFFSLLINTAIWPYFIVVFFDLIHLTI